MPELYTQWLKAREGWKEWRKIHPPKDWGFLKKDYRPGNPSPLFVAAKKAEQALIEACREKLIACEWIASGLRGSPDAERRSFDGDFFIDASFEVDQSGLASARRGQRTIEIYGLRVRRAVDVAKDQGIATPTPSGRVDVSAFGGAAAAVLPTGKALEPSIYSAPVKFLPQKPPKQFLDWAESERRSVGIITQGSAIAAMEKIFDVWPKGPSQKTVIAWCRKLDPEWTAKQGTPPSRNRRPTS